MAFLDGSGKKKFPVRDSAVRINQAMQLPHLNSEDTGLGFLADT